MKTIYLVRHGESVLNAGIFETFIDDASAPLTQLGEQQARFLAQRAQKLRFDALIASPFERTKRTAEAIAVLTGHSIEYSELFTERKYPEAIVGMLKSDPKAKILSNAGLDSSERAEGKVAGVETFQELKVRAGKALKFLEDRSEEALLVVGHGFFTRMLIGRVLYGEKLTTIELAPLIHGFRTNNTGISILKYDPSDSHCSWWVQAWNDHAHLG